MATEASNAGRTLQTSMSRSDNRSSASAIGAREVKPRGEPRYPRGVSALLERALLVLGPEGVGGRAAQGAGKSLGDGLKALAVLATVILVLGGLLLYGIVRYFSRNRGE